MRLLKSCTYSTKLNIKRKKKKKKLIQTHTIYIVVESGFQFKEAKLKDKIESKINLNIIDQCYNKIDKQLYTINAIVIQNLI